MFSNIKRKELFNHLKQETLDLLIIGGGITGAAIALDAQVRGIKTALLDMQDFAAGASSRSTKLFYGGLSSPKQIDVKQRSELSRERAIIHENAPHIVRQEWIIMPSYKEGLFNKLPTSFGIKLYDRLSGVNRDEKQHSLTKKQALLKEPLLNPNKLKGAGLFIGYQTDDARLTIETLKEAVSRGAKALNYVKVESYLYEGNVATGVIAVDQVTGEALKINAKKIVNATGPWLDQLRTQDRSKKEKFIALSKGIHLVFNRDRFPLEQAVYAESPSDSRLIFAVPRGSKTYVGTTETLYDEDPISPRMTEEEQAYLLKAINSRFPTLQLSEEDMVSSWAGVRPFVYEEEKEIEDIQQRDELILSESGIISIVTGNLSGYRKLAERVVDRVAKCLQIPKHCETDSITLSGGHVGSADQFESYIQKKVEEGIFIGLPSEEAAELVKLYGSNVTTIYSRIRTNKRKAESFHFSPSVYAQLRYGIEEEMVLTPLDFFVRRTGALYFDIEWVEQWKEPVLRYLRDLFEWSEEETALQEEQLNREIYYARQPFYP